MRVTYRSRARRGGSSGTVIVVPKQTGSSASASTADQQFALWVKHEHDQLTALRDQEALAKLADGHTEEFLSYAQSRVGSAESDAERDYWKGLVTKAEAKIEDDSLAAEVNAGTKSLEDVVTHLEGRMKGLDGGRSNPNYPALLKQLADVKNSIAARDFRNEMLDAQQKYINNPDKIQAKKDYAAVLTSMLYRAKDPDAQAEVKKQLDTVTTAIANDEQLKREQDLAVKTTAFHNGSLKFGDYMAFLADQAASAKTPAEAERYSSLAATAETTQRTRNNEALSAATKNGQAAIDQALFGPKEDYLNAKQRLANEIDKGVPSVETVNAFKTAASLYDDALRKAAPNATSLSSLETMIADIRTVSNDHSNLTREAATAVVDDALKKGANYERIVAAEKVGNEKDSADQAEGVSRARFQWTQALRDAASSPLLDGQDKEKARLDEAVNKVVGDQRVDIQREAGILGGQNQTAGQKKYDALYQAYLENGGTTPQDEWRKGVNKYELMTPEEASAEKARLTALLKDAEKPAAVKNQISTLDAAQEHSSEVADRTGALAAYTAFRGKDGSTTAGPDNLYAPGGALDESTRAQAPRTGPVSTGGPLMARPDALNGGLVPQPAAAPLAPVKDDSSAMGNWNANDFLPNDASTRLLEAHAAGNAALDMGGQSIPLPQWEIPPLPSEPAFTPGEFHIDYGATEPPPMDSFDAGAFTAGALPPPPFGVSAGIAGGDSGSAPSLAA